MDGFCGDLNFGWHGVGDECMILYNGFTEAFAMGMRILRVGSTANQRKISRKIKKPCLLENFL